VSQVKLPDVKEPGWRKQKFWPEFLLLVATLVASLATAIKLYPEPPTCPPCPGPTSWVWFGAAVVAFVSTVIAGAMKLEQTSDKDKDDAEVKGPISLIGCLFTLHSTILGLKDLDALDRTALRITVHKVKNGKLEQLVPYVGGEGGKPGRKIGMYGVVGRAVLTNAPVSMVREGDDPKVHLAQYLDELTSTWFVPKDVVQEMRHDRMSFLAVPLTNNASEVIGAVFLDAKDAVFFDDEAVRCVVNGCAGIAEFVKQYSRGS
jgi:hypothetical protein